MDSLGQEIAEIRTLASRSQSLLENLRARAAEHTEIRRQGADALGEEAIKLIEQVAAQIASELAAELSAKQDAEQKAERDRLTSAAAELNQQREAWNSEREAWEQVRVQVEAELSEREHALASHNSGHAEDLQKKLDEAAAEAEEKREQLVQQFAERGKQWEGRLSEQTGEIERLTDQLEKAHARIETTKITETQQVELLEKFDLALADLQTHRERVAHLEEELASRPQSTSGESAEMTQLRQERDDLIARLEQAEQRSGEASSGDGSQELEDLRRRFEMAVEDIRSLKTEKAELESRLANAGGSSDGGGGAKATGRPRSAGCSLRSRERETTAVRPSAPRNGRPSPARSRSPTKWSPRKTKRSPG